jgi:hypothetical protein
LGLLSALCLAAGIFLALLILLCWAQPILDLAFWAHMIQPVYRAKPFDPAAAAFLIVFTFVVGYVFGFFGAIIWNRPHGAK